MPGRELARVRVTADAEDLLDCPRLYVDGNSWFWCYAVDIVHSSLGAPHGEGWEWEGAKRRRPLFSTPEHETVRQRAVARWGFVPIARPACTCLSRNLSVTWLTRESAWLFGVHPWVIEEGPWCSRCGLPQKKSTP